MGNGYLADEGAMSDWVAIQTENEAMPVEAPRTLSKTVRRGRPVDPTSGRQRAMTLIQELYDKGVDRKDILGLVTDETGVAPATATTYVFNFYRDLKARKITAD